MKEGVVSGGVVAGDWLQLLLVPPRCFITISVKV